jgi:transposase
MAKKFNEEFKQTIVDLYKSGKGPTELAREYGVSVTAIYQWAEQQKIVTNVDGEEVSKKEILELKKEIARLKEENEILKKATAIFARNKL